MTVPARSAPDPAGDPVPRGPADGSGTFTKRRIGAPDGFFAVEAAGLRWLAEADGARVVLPLAVEPERLVLPRIPEVAPSAAAATGFGADLARTHAAGAPAFGAPPAGWTGDGYIGPLRLPHRPGSEWGAWYAEFRVLPYLRSARDSGAIDVEDATTIGRVLDLIADPALGRAGPVERPARLHGDLWNGNVLWTRDGVVLIDPAAHGGHRETDLAMLVLFGLPHLDEVLAGYDASHPLADGWGERLGLHQLHPLLVHATLFGGGYGRQAGAVARRYA
ncbi:MAG: fructosamine kinase family protein [Kineosporiaceae bacterium]